jgi:hypothetical protein
VSVLDVSAMAFSAGPVEKSELLSYQNVTIDLYSDLAAVTLSTLSFYVLNANNSILKRHKMT